MQETYGWCVPPATSGILHNMDVQLTVITASPGKQTNQGDAPARTRMDRDRSMQSRTGVGHCWLHLFSIQETL